MQVPPSTLNDLIKFRTKMFKCLTPFDDEEFEIELKKLGDSNKHLIKYIETYNNASNNQLKILVKFYLKYQLIMTEDDTLNILLELITFLLMKKFNCSKETQEDFKKSCKLINKLYTYKS